MFATMPGRHEKQTQSDRRKKSDGSTGLCFDLPIESMFFVETSFLSLRTDPSGGHTPS
ncbi:hypothetical protein [Acidocella sp.]|uniref:hypothetical protein n=1 Tax=Acidocella sp. TaxID=50710 RepID=UPI003CFD4851